MEKADEVCPETNEALQKMKLRVRRQYVRKLNDGLIKYNKTTKEFVMIDKEDKIYEVDEEGEDSEDGDKEENKEMEDEESDDDKADDKIESKKEQKESVFKSIAK